MNNEKFYGGSAMLCISACGASQHRYYTSLAQITYYTDGGERPGRWMGKTADHLKLWGQVEPEQLEQLFKGFDPATGAPLVQNAGQMKKQGGEKGRKNCDGSDPRKPGWDWCFHPPKELSVLMALSDRNTQRIIQPPGDPSFLRKRSSSRWSKSSSLRETSLRG